MERNEITRFTLPSTIGPQPMAAIWGLANERLQRLQPKTIEAMREKLTVFGQNCHNFVLICTLLTLLVDRIYGYLMLTVCIMLNTRMRVSACLVGVVLTFTARESTACQVGMASKHTSIGLSSNYNVMLLSKCSSRSCAECRLRVLQKPASFTCEFSVCKVGGAQTHW